MAETRGWMFRLTGRTAFPGFGYLARKSWKYCAEVPRTYLRIAWRRLTGFRFELEGRPIVFVCGLHRSGTSIVHRLMKAHPDISGISGTVVPEDEGQHLQNVFPSDRKYGLLFAFHTEAHLTEDSEWLVEDCRRRLLEEWGVFFNPRADVFIEKSPSNILRTRFLQKVFPESRFIFVIRHPVATALAQMKWVDATLNRVIEHWLVAHEILMRDAGKLRCCMYMRYEDLLTDPQQKIGSAMRFCGLEPVELSERFVNRNADYFARWESLDIDRQWMEAMSSRYGRVLEFFGYSLEPPFVRPMVAGAYAKAGERG